MLSRARHVKLLLYDYFRVFKQNEFLELSRVASGSFGSVVKVSKQSLVMVDGTVYVRANIYLPFHWLFFVQQNIFLIGVSQARH